MIVSYVEYDGKWMVKPNQIHISCLQSFPTRDLINFQVDLEKVENEISQKQMYLSKIIIGLVATMGFEWERIFYFA